MFDRCATIASHALRLVYTTVIIALSQCILKNKKYFLFFKRP
jgi:hypothetical protein